MAYPGSSAQQQSQCSTCISAGAGVSCGSLKYLAIAFLMTLGLSQGMTGVTLPIVTLTLGLSRGMNGVTQRELSFLLLLWGLSDPRIAELREMSRSFSIKLHSETQVSGRLGISGGGGGIGPLDMPRTPYQTSKGKRSQ